MSRTQTLKSLGVVLESFLDRAVALKEQRLEVLGGINRLDDIARGVQRGEDFTDQMGGWFAEHSQWLNSETLRAGDRNRIGGILGEIKRELGVSQDSSPAINKISSEIDRWAPTQNVASPSRSDGMAQEQPPSRSGRRVIVLRRGAEATEESQVDSISLFGTTLEQITALFKDVSGNRKHLMSVLDDALESAKIQNNKEALLLSALIIYYLKQNGYKTEPFVKRLKTAERLHERTESNA